MLWIFYLPALANSIEVTVFTDLTVKFPVRSHYGNNYIIITYIYNANTSLVRPVKSRETGAMIEAF